jgi:hypothetical protein
VALADWLVGEGKGRGYCHDVCTVVHGNGAPGDA